MTGPNVVTGWMHWPWPTVVALAHRWSTEHHHRHRITWSRDRGCWRLDCHVEGNR